MLSIDICALYHLSRKIIIVVLCTVLGLFAVKTWLRNKDWMSEASLYESGLQVKIGLHSHIGGFSKEGRIEGNKFFIKEYYKCSVRLFLLQFL